MMRLGFFFLLLFSISTHANTENNPLLGFNELNFSYSKSMTANPYSIAEEDWIAVNRGHLNLGLESSNVWIKFSIKNNLDAHQELFIFNTFVHLDKLTLYPVEQLSYEKQLLEQTQELENRNIIKTSIKKGTEQTFNVTLAPQETQHFFMRAETNGIMMLNLFLWQQDYFIKAKAKYNLVTGLFLGVMLASALILSVLFVITKKRNFALSATFNIGIWFIYAWLLGFLYRYTSEQIVWVINLLMPAFTIFILVPFNLLTMRILGKSNLSKPLLVSLRVTLGIALAFALILPFLSYSFALSIAFVFSTLHLVLLLFVTITVAVKKETKAQMLVMCILPLLIIFIYKCAILFSYNSHFSQPNKLFGCCYLLNSVILTLIAIYDHIQQRDIKVGQQQKRLAESKAKEAIQSETIRLQNQHQEELESKIQQRTFELEITLRELQEKNLELEELNTQDTLTGLKNRRHFDKKIQMEFRRSRREQSPLSIVMLDIDHFKSINDKYGHLIGDKAIKYVASIIKEAIKRPSDIACRYGGEEFALILANTDIKGATLIAERIRNTISEHIMQTDIGALNFTISAGVFCRVADANLEPNQYTDWADKALYEAKEQGRNRVCIANMPQSPEEFS